MRRDFEQKKSEKIIYFKFSPAVMNNINVHVFISS